jgi:hypothetical protein
MRKISSVAVKEPLVPFVDAQEMHRLHPDTFEVPTLEELRGVKPGDHVKVSTGDERFWVLVTRVIGGIIEGTVDNDLFMMAHGLRLGDTIRFRIENVYTLYD